MLNQRRRIYKPAYRSSTAMASFFHNELPGDASPPLGAWRVGNLLRPSYLALPLPDDEAPFGVVRVDSRYASGEAGPEIAGSTASIQSGRTPVIRHDFPGGQNALGTPLFVCMFCLI